MTNMFSHDVFVMLASDGFMCSVTGVSWLLQRAVLAGYVDWDRWGWALQSVRGFTPHRSFIAGVLMPPCRYGKSLLWPALWSGLWCATGPGHTLSSSRFTVS